MYSAIYRLSGGEIYYFQFSKFIQVLLSVGFWWWSAAPELKKKYFLVKTTIILS
jgi:hypothetical protein